MKKHCCDALGQQAEFTCPQHPVLHDCPDALVSYSPKFNEYALIVHDGGASGVVIAYCPWCGSKLPASLRERWFNELETLGFDDPFVQNIPGKYRTEDWYRDV
ncbi:hypothetical protein [Polaromonas sp. A23]|uniref:DUF6980 family protein n=1 Tax=Polaromonas sp. A23 TaxID=1944133 RepID=UPI000984428C|nr:hypothetical protein [Polaromonas sp. A23]OOG39828.1 hypothetical protein B0B52_14485 [Polaromonas sp. A23]